MASIVDAELGEGPPHAEVGEPAGAAAAEHEPGGVPRHEPGEPVEVGGRPLADVGDAVEAEPVGEAAATPLGRSASAGCDERQPSLDAASAAAPRRARHRAGAARLRRAAPTSRPRCGRPGERPARPPCVVAVRLEQRGSRGSSRRPGGTPTAPGRAGCAPESTSPGRPSAASMRAAHRWRVVPWRASSLAMRVTTHPSIDRRRDRHGDRSRPVVRRVRPPEPGQDRAGQLAASAPGGQRRGSGTPRRRSGRASLSRSATTVADRGARSIRPISPTISPRPTSPMSTPPCETARRPLTTRYPASDGSPSANSIVAGLEARPTRSTRRPRRRPPVDAEQLAASSRSPGGRRCAPAPRSASSASRRLVLGQPSVVRSPDRCDRTTDASQGADRGGARAPGERGDLAERRARPDDVDAGQLGTPEDLERPRRPPRRRRRRPRPRA